jgi:hypothetical protein
MGDHAERDRDEGVNSKGSTETKSAAPSMRGAALSCLQSSCSPKLRLNYPDLRVCQADSPILCHAI